MSPEPDAGLLVNVVTAAIGLAGLFIGLFTFNRTYKQSQEIKQKDVTKDILFPLIADFDSLDKAKIAKLILEDVEIKLTIKVKEKDKEISREISRVYNEESLSLALRDHKGSRAKEPWQPEDGKVRASFDALLDFFGRLEYLISVGLLVKDGTVDELSYFSYYVNLAASNKAVREYVKYYHFPLHGRLHIDLNSGHSADIKSH